jgi:hypothetical protein
MAKRAIRRTDHHVGGVRGVINTLRLQLSGMASIHLDHVRIGKASRSDAVLIKTADATLQRHGATRRYCTRYRSSARPKCVLYRELLVTPIFAE